MRIADRNLRSMSGRFVSDRKGLAAIEFAMVAPVLVLLILGVTTFYDMVRDRARIERVAYVVADAVGRKETVDTAFLDLMKAMAGALASSNETPEIRVTSISRGTLGFPKVDWSYASGTYVPLKTSDVQFKTYAVSIPLGGSTIMVEVRAKYVPTFRLFGVTKRTHDSTSFARPRLVSVIAKSN